MYEEKQEHVNLSPEENREPIKEPVKEQVQDPVKEPESPAKTKEKLTTTKQILYLVLIVWIGSLVFCAGSWYFRGTHPEGLMNSVNTVAVPTILSYAVKSGFEFVTKVKNGLFSTETK